MNFEKSAKFTETIDSEITAHSVDEFCKLLREEIEERLQNKQSHPSYKNKKLNIVEIKYETKFNTTYEDYSYTSQEILVTYEYDSSFEELHRSVTVLKEAVKRRDLLKKVPSEVIKEVHALRQEISSIEENIANKTHQLQQALDKSPHPH